MKRLSIAILFGISLAAAPAQACRNPAGTRAIIHSTLPAQLADDMVAIEVEFPAGLSNGEFRRSGSEARIVRVVRGDVPLTSVWVSPEDGQSSCSYAFANGHAGLLVGQLRNEPGRQVFEPIWVVRRNGFRIVP